MSEYTKPLPDLDDPLTAPFWANAREGKLSVQQCDDCGYRLWPPGPMCPECQSQRLTWVPISATGTLWSTAEYHRAFDPAFRPDLPYTVGLIELDDGPRMYGLLQGDPAGFALDGRVEGVFEPVTDGVTFVQWQMATPSPPAP